MSIESFPNLNIKEEKTKEVFDVEKVLERPESIFAEQEPTEKTKQEAADVYEEILIDQENVIGLGNAGVVLNETENACLKCVWEKADVEIKGKRFDLLPKKLRRLRDVQNYFAEINAKKRKFVSQGLSFEADNSPLKEAGLQIAAREILKKEGLEHIIPEINSILRLKDENEGEIEGYPYDAMEDVCLISMEKVKGRSFEDMILNYPEDQEIIEKINVDKIAKTLERSLEILHEQGLSHRDLSPRNVMINYETGEPAIIDFGKSKHDRNQTSDQEELDQLKRLILLLKRFQINPKKERDNLSTAYKKQEEKF